MLQRALAYIRRNYFKSLVIFLVILLMSSMSLVGIAIKEATNQASRESFKEITNSFSMQINRRVNQGTPRGAGNLKGNDIQTIINQNKAIISYIKRINTIGDLTGYDLIETPETKQNLTPDRAARFGHSLMLTGVNDSLKEDKFVSGVYQLVEGQHLTDGDKGQILLHKDLARKHGWKVGDKIQLSSNIYDADNQKQAKVSIDITIKGLFDGHNQGSVTYAQELYENTAITDIQTASALYGYDEQTALYEDATFFVAADKNLDSVMKKLTSIQSIDWQSYNLIKSSSNYPALEKSISGMYRMADFLFWGGLILSILLLLLFFGLWINARRKEVGIFLSIGLKHLSIWGQFVTEAILIALPALILTYSLANYTATDIGRYLLSDVTTTIAKETSKAVQTSNLGGGAEVDGFNKTLTDLAITIDFSQFSLVFSLSLLLLVLAVTIAAYPLLRKEAKTLLLENE
ncbi:ABC transporter membrane-spanning permease, Pep export, Vex3 [Streptococcus sp. DD10]|uniref:FtsX-like permease family protein n=1 Tax=Streptococcus sp. DD10 TaxID=1777878 RepID=UPI0007968059|nr:FtsX-like permease family protein [Streptococcus sp. DD10]KXT74434.1 ABC transporter membrane-spanning permease, Pep export, Vex3 [Streptococcus sp. DD10]